MLITIGIATAAVAVLEVMSDISRVTATIIKIVKNPPVRFMDAMALPIDAAAPDSLIRVPAARLAAAQAAVKEPLGALRNSNRGGNA